MNRRNADDLAGRTRPGALRFPRPTKKFPQKSERYGEPARGRFDFRDHQNLAATNVILPRAAGIQVAQPAKHGMAFRSRRLPSRARARVCRSVEPRILDKPRKVKLSSRSQAQKVPDFSELGGGKRGAAFFFGAVHSATTSRNTSRIGCQSSTAGRTPRTPRQEPVARRRRPAGSPLAGVISICLHIHIVVRLRISNFARPPIRAPRHLKIGLMDHMDDDAGCWR